MFISANSKYTLYYTMNRRSESIKMKIVLDFCQRDTEHD